LRIEPLAHAQCSVPAFPGSEVIGGVQQPGIPGVGGEQDQRADGDQASVVSGGAALDVVNLVGEPKTLARQRSLAGAPFGADRYRLFVIKKSFE
jgi:hypothetical protein